MIEILVYDRLSAGDVLIIGGAMANTFLAAEGVAVGASLCEPDRFSDCRTIVAKARARDIRLLLPSDLRIGKGIKATSGRNVTVADADLADDDMALDIGPGSEQRFASALQGAKIVFWNGPMGLFENAAFARGTMAMAAAVAACPGYTVVGGGDSVAAIHASGQADRIRHISTGGGASLEMIEGQVLPGVAALLEE